MTPNGERPPLASTDRAGVANDENNDTPQGVPDVCANPTDSQALLSFRLAARAAGAVWIGDAIGAVIDEMDGAA